MYEYSQSMADVIICEDDVTFLGVVVRQLRPTSAVTVQPVGDEHFEKTAVIYGGSNNAEKSG